MILRAARKHAISHIKQIFNRASDKKQKIYLLSKVYGTVSPLNIKINWTIHDVVSYIIRNISQISTSIILQHL